MLRNFFAIITAFILILCCGALTGCKEKSISRTFFTADTVCTVTLYDGNEKALDGVIELCNSLSKLMDANQNDSELYKLNNEGRLVNINPDLYNVIKCALRYAEKSNGKFDPTVRAYTTLWNFKDEIIPSEEELNSASEFVGYKNICLGENSVTLNNGAQLELGGIAKGYIADSMCSYLERENVSSAIINLGGNVTLLGNNCGEKFSVGIQSPKSNDILATVLTENRSIVTSGTYQRCFEKNGRLYHHILDPKNGTPINNNLSSVTIIAPLGADADALSTLCFILGEKKGAEFIEDLENTEGIFIDKDNNISLTSGLKINGKNVIEFIL